ncbi:hypothetical protein [Novosphingobium sp. B 225]|uniref:hypothetical protein n=1 Tax=Novosphingobium sp. B 225 TaxID=1961849 RepID=UPI001124FBE9|nr:hypothetical protein [Novosphingobium sp. B 225]
MIALLALLLGVASPDPAPLRAAVEGCDRTSVADLARAEPRRRAEWAGAVYAEQRAIAAARGGLASADAAALAGLDQRQQQLDDARAVERAWRDYYDEYRSDFLASCSGRRRDDGN